MTLYEEQIQKIKNGDIFDFMHINCNHEMIELKIVDESNETAKLLLEWRNYYSNWFETKFSGSVESTKKWINNNILSNPRRILFLIIYKGKKVGHAGLFKPDKDENSIWLENFIRAPKLGPPDLMIHVVNSFFTWIFEDLKISSVKVQLFSDNVFSKALCKKCGFEIIKTIPNKKVLTSDGWKWIEANNDSEKIERYQHILEISREKYSLSK